MSEKQWRVVADRDKGDDPKISDAEDGDLLAFRKGREFKNDYLVRIERPVPAIDETKRVPEASCFRTDPHGPHYWGQYQGDKYTKHCLGLGSERAQPSPHPPTREQIAKAIQDIKDGNGVRAVATLEALIQNGAER